MIYKTCLKCGQHHMYLAHCDPQTRRDFLARSFIENHDKANADENAEIAKYMLRRNNP